MGLGFLFLFVSFLGCMATVMGVLEFGVGWGGVLCLRLGLTSICFIVFDTIFLQVLLFTTILYPPKLVLYRTITCGL